MRRNNRTLVALSEFFAKNGGPMDIKTYKDSKDTPARYLALRRAYGSWSRVLSLVAQVPTEDTPIVEKKPAAKKAVTKNVKSI